MHPSIKSAIDKGILEPARIIDDEGQDLRGWRFTKAYLERYAPEIPVLALDHCPHCGASTREDIAVRCEGEDIGLACEGAEVGYTIFGKAPAE